MLNAQVINFRAVPTKDGSSLLGFFDVLVGDSTESEYTLKLNNCALKLKKDGGYWWQAPGQKRIDKKTGKVVQENGFDKYDDHFGITLSKAGETYRPSVEGTAFKNTVLDQAVAALKGGKGAKVGRPKVDPAALAGAPASRTARPDDEFPEDDLPF